MSARDKFHGIVKSALQKDGWVITDDPLYISFGGVQMYIDLGVERLIAAEKQGERIAVEIKSFINTSAIYDFHLAFGQFLNYRTALREKDPQRILYLAVSEETYNDFLLLPFPQLQIQEYHVKLIIYDVNNEEIVKWLK